MAHAGHLGTTRPLWLRKEEELANLPSIKEGISPLKELEFRRKASIFIHDMVDRLNHNIKEQRAKISHGCLYTAIVHMHRFFLIHSFKTFDNRDVAVACLFVATKSEECPRKLEHIVRVWFMLKYQNELKANHIDLDPIRDNEIIQVASDYIVFLEGVILQTIGFDLQLELPHKYVINEMTKIAPGNNKLAQSAYWFATGILQLTNWCVRYSPRQLACVCIGLCCAWAGFEIPQSANTGGKWFKSIEPDLTEELLERLISEFIEVYKECLAHPVYKESLKKTIPSISQSSIMRKDSMEVSSSIRQVGATNISTTAPISTTASVKPNNNNKSLLTISNGSATTTIAPRSSLATSNQQHNTEKFVEENHRRKLDINDYFKRKRDQELAHQTEQSIEIGMEATNAHDKDSVQNEPSSIASSTISISIDVSNSIKNDNDIKPPRHNFMPDLSLVGTSSQNIESKQERRTIDEVRNSSVKEKKNASYDHPHYHSSHNHSSHNHPSHNHHEHPKHSKHLYEEKHRSESNHNHENHRYESHKKYNHQHSISHKAAEEYNGSKIKKEKSSRNRSSPTDRSIKQEHYSIENKRLNSVNERQNRKHEPGRVERSPERQATRNAYCLPPPPPPPLLAVKTELEDGELGYP